MIKYITSKRPESECRTVVIYMISSSKVSHFVTTKGPLGLNMNLCECLHLPSCEEIWDTKMFVFVKKNLSVVHGFLQWKKIEHSF